MLITSFSATPYTAFLWLPIVMVYLIVVIRVMKQTVGSYCLTQYVDTLECVQVLSLVLMVSSIARSVTPVSMQYLCVMGILIAQIILMKSDVVNTIPYNTK